MSLAVVTKKEFQDAIRSYTLYGLITLFVAMTAFWAAIHWIPEISDPVNGNLDTIALLNSMRQPAIYLIPMVSIVVGHKAIAAERESGSIRLLLSLPHTRRHVVVGKVLGQTTVVAAAIILGYVAAGSIAFLTYDSFAFVIFGKYLILSVLYALVCLSIAVAVSASARQIERAFAGAVGLYLVLLILWDTIVAGLIVVFVGWSPQPGEIPDWLTVLHSLNPSTAFAQATRAVIPVTREITTFPTLESSIWIEWYGFIVLGLWIVIPVGLSYLLFERADIQ